MKHDMTRDRFERQSTPIVNVLFDDSSLKRILHMHRTLRPPVDALKSRLGRQKFTWTTGARRHWAWEGDGWRVFANNYAGISFEVFDVSTAAAALDDFERLTGLTVQECNG